MVDGDNAEILFDYMRSPEANHLAVMGFYAQPETNTIGIDQVSYGVTAQDMARVIQGICHRAAQLGVELDGNIRWYGDLAEDTGSINVGFCDYDDEDSVPNGIMVTVYKPMDVTYADFLSNNF